MCCLVFSEDPFGTTPAAYCVGGAASRMMAPELNINFAYRDPVWHRAWGPAPIHVLFMAAGLVVLLQAPVHVLLRRAMPRPRRRATSGAGVF